MSEGREVSFEGRSEYFRAKSMLEGNKAKESRSLKEEGILRRGRLSVKS